MNKIIIPEKRSSYFENYNNFYKRILPNNNIEYYSKDFFNKDFTRKLNDDDDDILDNIQKEIILLQINDLFDCVGIF